MENRNYSIKEIADWMMNPGMVSLPAMQRGFVWQPFKIEDLWDSVFRDFPIGSFMFTAEGGNYMLLDGQQRATSISLGFYNPWVEEKNKIGNAINIPVIWVDLAPQECPDNSEFVFRATTRSHPWGYQLKNNGNILSVPDRLCAAEMYHSLFGENTYTNLKASQRLPFDAYLPVPLCFLFESFYGSKDYVGWRQVLLDMCRKYIPSGFRPKPYVRVTEWSYLDYLSTLDLEKYYKIITRIADHYSIPTIIVDNKLIMCSSDNAESDPTLFVRLNSAGT